MLKFFLGNNKPISYEVNDWSCRLPLKKTPNGFAMNIKLLTSLVLIMLSLEMNHKVHCYSEG